MKKLILYPYNKDAIWVVKNKELLMEYNLVGICTNCEDKEIATDFADKNDIQYISDWNKYQSEFDSVLFLNNIEKCQMKAYCVRINEAISCGKEVLMTKELYKELNENDFDIPQDQIHFLENCVHMEVEEDDYLFDINVPVVLVCSFGENCNKMEVQLEMMRNFINKGYHAVVIASNEIGNIFSTHTIPSFLLEEQRIKENVVSLNHYIHQIEQDEKPDIIIIGAPGSIMPMNKFILNDFGILAYQISYAAPPDICVVGTNFSMYMTDGYFDELERFCQYRLNAPKSYFYVSSQKIRYKKTEKELDTFFLADNIVKRLYGKRIFQKDIPCVVDKNQMQDFYDKIINTLRNNIGII
ncbi:MAG: TIGR04066 family peptide maturation system protein [Clostridium sp.]|nr:TIGR04066 family peptide maturation system protein [Clostridium sp.]